MRGHIRKRGKTWVVVIELPRDPLTGKRRQQWYSGYRTKADAQKRLTEILTSVDKGTFVKPVKLTTGEYLQRWLQDYASISMRKRTYERYESIIRIHLIPALGRIPLKDLKPYHIQACYCA